MPFIEKQKVFESFKKNAVNSSHFVWLLAKGMNFFEASNGWIFAFTQINDITLIALEPLIPGAPTTYQAEHHQAFQSAWREFHEAANVKIAAFVSVYDAFLPLLHELGFQSVKVGQEPWIDLVDCIPTGNAGKGVRSARNRALSAGVSVEEWTAQEIQSQPGKRALMEEIHSHWEKARLVNLGGFMNATNPYVYMEERRYFILRTQARVEGYLVATPVPGIQSYFLEDLFLRENSPRGSGELLTLEAMIRLQESGAKLASLGVVSLTTLNTNSSKNLPKLVKLFMITIPKYMQAIYNFNGMEIYRKRFKPKTWKSIHLAIKNEQAETSDTSAWIKVIFSIFKAFRPKIQLSLFWLFKNTIWNPIKSYPITCVVVAASFSSFALINRFGILPDWALSQFGFFGDAPWNEWLYRSVISDFLYFDRWQFFEWGVGLFIIVFWAEKSHSKLFLAPLIALISIFDDFINYWVLILPYQYFQPKIFNFLVSYKDVGGSLILSTLLGLQLCQFRLIREPLFAVITLSLVLAFAFTSAQLKLFALNLNHPVFFVLGYLIGKAHFEYHRYLSRRAAKKKPPVAKSVLPPQKIKSEHMVKKSA